MTKGELRRGADEVARRLREAGFEAYLAGGCVRDLLRGEEPKDYDITTSARPEQVSALFARTVQIGAAFGVVRVLLGRGREYEVATYRTDGDYSDGRRPDHISYSESKEEDVLRRVFTINALLMDPEGDQVIDLVGGRADLARGVVRAVGEAEQRFREDRLRMLRAVRFAARFGFRIEEETLEVIRRHASAIIVVSAERIVAELEGIFTGPDPARGYTLLLETGLASAVLPFLHALHAPATDALALLLQRLPAAGQGLEKDERTWLAWGALFWVALRHDPRIREAGERERRSFVDRAMRELKLSRDHLRVVQRLLELAPRLLAPERERPAERVRWALAPDQGLLGAYLEVLAGPGAAPLAGFRQEVQQVAERPLPELPLVTGEDLKRLGVAPGPAYKTLLAAVEDEILERRIHTREAALAFVEARVVAAR